MSNKKEISVPEVKDNLALEVGSDTVAEGKQKSSEAVMYLGPTIVGVIRHSTVFKEGVLPEKVQECVKQLPMMERLFVSIGDIPEAVKEINKNQSVLRTIYGQVTNNFV